MWVLYDNKHVYPVSSDTTRYAPLMMPQGENSPLTSPPDPNPPRRSRTLLTPYRCRCPSPPTACPWTCASCVGAAARACGRPRSLCWGTAEPSSTGAAWPRRAVRRAGRLLLPLPMPMSMLTPELAQRWTIRPRAVHVRRARTPPPVRRSYRAAESGPFIGHDDETNETNPRHELWTDRCVSTSSMDEQVDPTLERVDCRQDRAEWRPRMKA